MQILLYALWIRVMVFFWRLLSQVGRKWGRLGIWENVNICVLNAKQIQKLWNCHQVTFAHRVASLPFPFISDWALLGICAFRTYMRSFGFKERCYDCGLSDSVGSTWVMIFCQQFDNYVVEGHRCWRHNIMSWFAGWNYFC